MDWALVDIKGGVQSGEEKVKPAKETGKEKPNKVEKNQVIFG